MDDFILIIHQWIDILVELIDVRDPKAAEVMEYLTGLHGVGTHIYMTHLTKKVCVTIHVQL